MSINVYVEYKEPLENGAKWDYLDVHSYTEAVRELEVICYPEHPENCIKNYDSIYESAMEEGHPYPLTADERHRLEPKNKRKGVVPRAEDEDDTN